METGSNTFGGSLAKLPIFIQGLTRRQKLLMAGTAAAILMVLGVFVFFLGGPEYKVLYAPLPAADAQSVVAKLASKKIDYRLSPDGGIQVRGDQLDAARLEVAADGPRGQRMGFELFDKPNWLANDFADNVNYQRALEGELERTIQSLSEVESARVHIVLPRESLFQDRAQKAKAAIVLKLRQRLSSEQAKAITYLVAGAVNDLDPDRVTLVDADGRMPLPGNRNGPGYSAQGSDLENQLSQKLTATLEPVVGPGHVRATVVVDYDLGSTEDTRESYDPNSAVALSMQKSEERSTDGGLGGVPGTASNLPNSKSVAAVPVAGDGSQYSKTESGTYGVNRSVHHVMQPPGAIKRISAAVLVDDVVLLKNGTTTRTKRTPEQMQEIEKIARAAVGLDPSRNDVLAIQNLAFEEPDVLTTPHLGPAQRVWTVVQRSSDLFRYVVLLALFFAAYLLLLRPLKRQVISAIRALPAPTPATGALAANAAKAALIAPQEDDENVALRRQLVEKVKREPANASRLVQNWLRQTEVQK